MKEKIEKLLYGELHEEDILSTVATTVYELVQNNKAQHRVLYDMLAEYESCKSYIAAENEELSFVERDILTELEEDLSYLVDMAFDNNEDLVMGQLLVGVNAAYIREDLRKRGIEFNEAGLEQDTVELAYEDVFKEYDRYHVDFLNRILDSSPKDFYEQGKAEKEAFRKKHHILFDEDDFVTEYSRTFNKNTLWRMLRDRLKEAFTYGRRYNLISVADEEDDEADGYEDVSLTDELTLPEDYDETANEILEPCGELHAEDFSYVTEMLMEFTGRRVMAAENEWGTGAYWTTYEDDFQEIISYFVLDHFEDVISAMSEERAVEWNSFGRMLGLEAKDRGDALQILDHSERINYFLSTLNEHLFTEFSESKVKDILNVE